VIPGFLEKPGASFDANALSGYGEAGYNARYGLLTATPFVGLEFASLRTGGFTENNQGFPSTIGLSYAARTTTSLPSFLGLQLEGKGDLPNAMGLDLWARAAWKYEFDATRSTESAFIAAPGFDFVVQGAQPPRDALVTSIGAKLNVTKNAAIFGTFEGQFGWGSNSIAGTGGLVITW
jgi:outer membrane autotransporter protein